MQNKRLISLFLLLLTAQPSLAAEWKVDMLSYGEKGPMVFEPAFIDANVGDTVTFVPTQSGHYVKSYLVPEGQTGWESKLNEQMTITLTQEGVSLFYCPPHLMMGMVGVIKVGKAVNKAQFDEKYPKLRAKVALNPERVDAIVQPLQ